MKTISLGFLAFIALTVSCAQKDRAFTGGAGPSATIEDEEDEKSEAVEVEEENSMIGVVVPEPVPPAPVATVPEVIPSNAIVKGSFTFYTTPADPQPRQRYQIHIKATAPKALGAFTIDDFYVYVVGTDFYTLLLSEYILDLDSNLDEVFSQATTPAGDHEATVTLSIPGGAAEVKDTIDVRSTKLKESQKVILEF